MDRVSGTLLLSASLSHGSKTGGVSVTKQLTECNELVQCLPNLRRRVEQAATHSLLLDSEPVEREQQKLDGLGC